MHYPRVSDANHEDVRRASASQEHSNVVFDFSHRGYTHHEVLQGRPAVIFRELLTRSLKVLRTKTPHVFRDKCLESIDRIFHNFKAVSNGYIASSVTGKPPRLSALLFFFLKERGPFY